jgi:hypothetical protein
MIYIAKIMDDVKNVNSYDLVDEIHLTRGNQFDLYFQLQSRKQLASNGDYIDTRYIPLAVGATVEVQFDNLDKSYQIRRVASKPFAEDGSIYKITLIKQDIVMFNSMRVVVNENNNATAFKVVTDIATEDTGSLRRFI